MTTEEPRIVIIRSSSYPSGRGIRSSTPVPAALHVCTESRAIALKSYKLSFSVSNQYSFPAQIYFSFARDVLYFRNDRLYKGLHHFDEFMAACLPADRQQVQAVGLDIVAKAKSYSSTLYDSTSYITLYGSEIRRSFEGLETFFVCQERARFNMNRAIRFCPLQKGQEWAFVRHYIWHLERASAFKHLPLAEALDKIKDEFLPRHMYEKESSRPDIRFVMVDNRI
jgi:2EXR family